MSRSRAPAALRRMRFHREAMRLALAERLTLRDARWRLITRSRPEPADEPTDEPLPWWQRW